MHGPAARRQIRQAFERVDQPLGLLLDMHRWMAANVGQKADLEALRKAENEMRRIGRAVEERVR